MMNKNTAILDNTMMDAYLTVTEGVSDNCGVGLAFASLLESAKKNLKILLLFCYSCCHTVI